MHQPSLSQQSVPQPRYRLAALLAALLVFLATPAWGSELPASVSAALKDAGIPERSVAVVVQGVDQPQPLLRHNALQAMNPASTMKLVTTYAALELLGPAYTWKTEVLADAPAPNGQSQLSGNVYLRGSGDPRLALEQFWLLLRQLRARGVTSIDGDLVLDRSAFSLPAHDPAAFDNEPLRPYNAGPDALLINLKSIRLTLHPDGERKAVSVLSETPGDDLRVDNRLLMTADACGDWRERIKVKVDGTRIELSGNFSAACGDKALSLSPWPADVQVEQLFRALWRELGGTLRGTVRDGLTPSAAHALAVAESPPLAEVVREINKYSNNVMARQLFLTLSGERPASPDGARRRITAWLAGKPLQLPQLVLDNGSGLSRSERISAEGLAQLLLAAWKSPVMPELMASLPLAGVDGTLKKRLGNSAATGRAHLKTGYLEEVRAIAGYTLDSRDKRWVVVFLINDPKSRLGKPAIDALLKWVAER
ncbi:MAG: D-alanyl-D-alanine carboxypeptidase/D-alanyl-D-alanine-endopeptidase [Proteobacteria bacterium]|nr:D-alanyl-D-alanine carboxypeptidase/D-alanyl-D-alanine-endopeptidase [Pseudomonadota bacterium]